MNDRLADLASHQVEAIDNVLDMVARDRLRVSALVEQAESPSLRRHLRDWLDEVPVVPVRYISDNNGEEAADENVSLQSLEQHDDEHQIASLENLNTEQSDRGLQKITPHCDWETQSCSSECCRENCWENYSRSFWDIYSRNPRCFRQHFRSVMTRHKQQRSRLAYGVPYQWVTESLDVRANEFARSTGCFDFEDADQFFQGRRDHIQTSVLERVLDQNNHAIAALIDESYGSRVDENHFSRAIMIDEKDTIAMSLFFRDTNNSSVLPTVDQVKQAGGIILHDIIYFGMESRVRRADPFRYGRTAKGLLSLSVTTTESCANGAADGDYDDFQQQQQQQPSPRIQGIVEMDPANLPDMLPIGGAFSFTESRRKERLIWDRSSPAGGEPCLSAASVMDVTAFFPESEDKKYCQPGVYHHASFATGEVRVISQRIAVTLANEKSVCFREHVMGLGQADACTQNYLEKKCRWMHRHTDLPKDVIQRIGDYVSPAPIFYLEQGDVVIDIDCTRNVRPDIHGVAAFSKSCVIARRR